MKELSTDELLEKATKRPWRAKESPGWGGRPNAVFGPPHPDGGDYAALCRTYELADAELIARAVNSFEAMRRALNLFLHTEGQQLSVKAIEAAKHALALDADSAEDAARQARAAQVRADTTATVFNVTANSRRALPEQVDLPPGNPQLLALIDALRELIRIYSPTQAGYSEKTINAWMNAENALAPFAEIPEQTLVPVSNGLRWQVSVKLKADPNGKQPVLAGFSSQADAEHWADMIDENPEYAEVIVSEVPMIDGKRSAQPLSSD